MTKDNTIKKDIKKLRKNKLFLTIMVLLFVSMLFWIIISLIGSQTSEKVSKELTLISKPLTPVIDKEIFNTIEQKRVYSQEELSGFTIYKVITSRDGRSESVVPIEVTIDDLEPKEQLVKNKPSKTLLDDVNSEEEIESTQSGQTEPSPIPEFEDQIPESPSPSPVISIPTESSLGSQL
jgi:hypothetical protein